MSDDGDALTLPPRLVEALRQAERVVALTGAGMSAESGVPTFRDAQTGLWVRHRPEDLATPEAFRRQPDLVWRWYAWRRELVDQAAPHAGHHALVELERLVPRLSVITQNVDSLHQRAGSAAVIELHGNITRTRCANEGVIVTDWPPMDEEPPRCPRCGGPLRPDVVWFNEALPKAALDAAHKVIATCDLLLVIGTSAVVQPAASLPYLRPAGAMLVEINPSPTDLTGAADIALNAPAGQVVPALVRAAWPT